MRGTGSGLATFIRGSGDGDISYHVDGEADELTKAVNEITGGRPPIFTYIGDDAAGDREPDSPISHQ